jgi:hypothetical protein
MIRGMVSDVKDPLFIENLILWRENLKLFGK